MDPVLLDILLDSKTKYLIGTRQTKCIVGSNRKKKPDYWDKICQVNGDTQEKKEHDYWPLPNTSFPIAELAVQMKLEEGRLLATLCDAWPNSTIIPMDA